MVPAVIKVLPVDDYVLSIFFENGEYGRLDMTEYLDFGVFNRLKDPKAFRRVRVSFDTVEWDVGVDLDPEFVYAKCDIAGTAQSSDLLTETLADCP
jgi:hypothetical protein